MNWKKVKLGDILEKVHIKYENWKENENLTPFGVSKFNGITKTDMKKSEDLSKYLVVQPNFFAYNPYRINIGSVGLTPENVFGIVSPAYVVFKIKDDLVYPKMLLDFLKSEIGLNEINKYAKGTVRKALRFEDLSKIEYLLLSKENQLEYFDKTSINDSIITALSTETKNQNQLLTQLRQSILQDAIQGKLTETWRAENPTTETAAMLLKRIKAEKEKLIKEKKIKKEKPLPPIPKTEIPFELPKGWGWCRLGEILLYSNSGKSPNCEKRPVISNEWGVLTTTSIQSRWFNQEANKVLPQKYKVNIEQQVSLGDILITRAGPLNRTGVCCRVHKIDKNLILSDKTICLKHDENLVLGNFIVLSLNDFSIRQFLVEKMTGMAESQVNISQSNIKGIPIPLPPLSEQKAIVEKVEALMAQCSELSAEIVNLEQQGKHLLKAMFNETFETKQALSA